MSGSWEPTGGEQAPIHPAQKGPSDPPRHHRQPSRQVLSPERGSCGGDKGPLLQELSSGAQGQVEAGVERSSATPPVQCCLA